jgi:hypothetical protein
MPWQPALLATYFKEYSFADKRAVHFCSPSPMGQWNPTAHGAGSPFHTVYRS